jgi:hypothetical protein
MDNVAIVVDDLHAAVAFFIALVEDAGRGVEWRGALPAAPQIAQRRESACNGVRWLPVRTKL